MRVAFVYDRVNKWGGAERVLLALHKLYPDAPLFTSVYDKDKASWAKVFKVNPSFLQNIPFAKNYHQFFAPFMPFAFESFNFKDFDLVISVTSESAKGIITTGKTKHLCYMLTPTRYLWSGYDEYFSNKILRLLSKPIINGLRIWDLQASKRPDQIVAISEEVRKRIKKYYKREADVVYPPVTLESRIKNQESREGNYFVVVSRLSKFTKYKRVDLAIAAANELGINLKIVGDGDIEYYKKISGPTVEFVGKVSDEELIKYYRSCKALIFPGYEDLGLVMIEAQIFGKPIIAFEKGGAREIVIDNKTGILFEKQTKESLIGAIKKFNGLKLNPEGAVVNSSKFKFENFKKSFQIVVNNLF